MQEPEESNLVSKGPCASCGSSDACASYDDGHTHCFSCGVHGWGDKFTTTNTRKVRMTGLLQGDVRALPKRGLSEATCAKFGYKVGVNARGRNVQIADYRDAEGNVVAQHTRDSDKDFAWVGDAKIVTLWGQHLWKGEGRRIVVTEGEIDALSVAQATGLNWPVASIPNGAQGAKKAIQRNLEFLEGYSEVVLWFDDDEPGRDAVAECAPLFTPGRCKVVTSPPGCKDANDVLLKLGVKAAGVCVYEAKAFRPDGIVSLEDIEEDVMADPEQGRPYPFAQLTAKTFGRRLGDVIALGAGTGVGKTDVFTQMIAFDALTLNIPTGVIYLEQPAAETGKRLAGKVAGKRFHVPDGSWTKEELSAAYGALKASGNLHLYNARGGTSWEVVKGKLRYMIAGLGCQHIYLDHLTALASEADDERRALEQIMAEMAGMAHELGAVIHFISHLATPEGKPHEEGGRVMIRHFKGSRAIGFWSLFMLALEGDQSQPGSDRVLRVLKDRYTGQSTGWTIGIHHDAATGLLTEVPLGNEGGAMMEDESGGECPF